VPDAGPCAAVLGPVIMPVLVVVIMMVLVAGGVLLVPHSSRMT
jgi:hypothetical protein